jgi:hypothetical protein
MKGHQALGDWTRLCEVNFPEYIDSVFVFCKGSMVELGSCSVSFDEALVALVNV